MPRSGGGPGPGPRRVTGQDQWAAVGVFWHTSMQVTELRLIGISAALGRPVRPIKPENSNRHSNYHTVSNFKMNFTMTLIDNEFDISNFGNHFVAPEARIVYDDAPDSDVS